MFRAILVLAVCMACASPTRAQVVFRDAADRDAFRRWFLVLADAQFYRTTADVTDCAALVRHAVRETLRSQSPDWIRTANLPAAVSAPAVHAKATERDGALMLFRVTAGGTPRYAEFADAKTIVRFNTRPMGRDVAALRPGDLLYFRQHAEHMPDHLMVFVGRSAFEADHHDWVVYHTGPSSGDEASPPGVGEMRKVRLADLTRHPSERWRPVPANDNFVGVFRPTLFTQ